MATFDRFDICEAHYALEIDYNVGGWLHERPSNQRRKESTNVQLHRMQFKPAPSFNGYKSLSENGKEIYDELVQRYGLPVYEPTPSMHCDQCEMLSIQGAACHETGCPNMGARWDADDGVWVKQRVCFDCGCTVDHDDPCCQGEQS